MTSSRTCGAIVALLAMLFASLPLLFDFDQCNRSCKYHFGGLRTYRSKDPHQQITGFWTLTDRVQGIQRCFCEATATAKGGVPSDGRTRQLGDIPRLMPEEELGHPYIWRDPSVCGLDGKVYKSGQEARARGVKPLHCGPHCGECSTEHDVRQYQQIGQDAAKVIGPCILSYLVGGAYLDSLCMASRAKFTPACNDCWVEDHGCLASHCFYDCVLKAKQHWNRFLGMNKPEDRTEDSDACLVCMEKFCSAPFIRTCGVNRRSAGVRTDIDRDPKQICKEGILS